MTLDQLKALDAVVLCGSIRAASQMLHKTPPAISTLIKNLEKDIDIQLLDRDGYRPSLTPEGSSTSRSGLPIMGEVSRASASIISPAPPCMG